MDKALRLFPTTSVCRFLHARAIQYDQANYYTLLLTFFNRRRVMMYYVLFTMYYVYSRARDCRRPLSVRRHSGVLDAHRLCSTPVGSRSHSSI